MKTIKAQNTQEETLNTPPQQPEKTLDRGPLPGRELLTEIPFSIRNLSA